MNHAKTATMTQGEFALRVRDAFPDAHVERLPMTGELVIYTGWVQRNPDSTRQHLRWGAYVDES